MIEDVLVCWYCGGELETIRAVEMGMCQACLKHN